MATNQFLRIFDAIVTAFAIRFDFSCFSDKPDAGAGFEMMVLHLVEQFSVV